MPLSSAGKSGFFRLSHSVLRVKLKSFNENRKSSFSFNAPLRCSCKSLSTRTVSELRSAGHRVDRGFPSLSNTNMESVVVILLATLLPPESHCIYSQPNNGVQRRRIWSTLRVPGRAPDLTRATTEKQQGAPSGSPSRLARPAAAGSLLLPS